MKAKAGEAWKPRTAVSANLLHSRKSIVWAQSLGPQPQFNVAVQGPKRARSRKRLPELHQLGGNVIAPVGAGGAVVGAVVSWLHGRGVGRWLAAAAGLLAVSGITRLIEFWITNGTGGVT